jgi:hypothetical protein
MRMTRMDEKTWMNLSDVSVIRFDCDEVDFFTKGSDECVTFKMSDQLKTVLDIYFEIKIVKNS